MLQVERLATVRFRDPSIPDQHVSQTFVWEACLLVQHLIIDCIPYLISQTKVGNPLLESKRNISHRTVLTERQRSALFDLPTDEPSLLRHYTLADDDLEYIQARRRAHNCFGFALQLCALRFPGRLLAPGEIIPLEAEAAGLRVHGLATSTGRSRYTDLVL